MVPTPFNKESLQELVKSKIGQATFVIASNREPFIHIFKEKKIEAMKPASGMVTALEPIMRACQGIWVAHGSGSADRKAVDKKDHVAVPPEDPKYTIRRLWLTKEEENGYYYGFSNETLWPLCHIVFARPTFRFSDWETYQRVNHKFAEAILQEIEGKKAFVWVQDYHLALVPGLIKKKRPDVLVAQFWHIPWPNPEAFHLCPWNKEILQGLLGNDLLGFHTRYHCDHFLQSVNQTLETRVDPERWSVSHKGGAETLVRPFPISIDFEAINKMCINKDFNTKNAQAILEGVPDNCLIALSIDRMDYTKGIPERLMALDRFLEKHPEWKGKFILLQVGALSRIHNVKYKELQEEINKLVEEINWKHESEGWAPIIFIRRVITPEDVTALYRVAHICIVSSLHDGMNLVAKEYVASRFKEDGVLILSAFTGAAKELETALQINPYDIESFADAIHAALTMSPQEQKERMQKLRETVSENNIYAWAGNFVSALAQLS